MSHIVDVTDEKSPEGIIHMLRGRLREEAEKISEEYALMSEWDLRRRIRPTNTDYALRTNFWREYERLVKAGKTVLPAYTVFTGVCSDTYFYNRFLKDPERVAWLLRPMQTYMREVEAMLARGSERLWELLEMDIYAYDRKTNEILRGENGKKRIDSNKAAILLNVVKSIEDRALGMAVQRNESKNLHAHLVGPKRAQMAGASTPVLDGRIKELTETLEGSPLETVVAQPEEESEEAFIDDLLEKP